MKAVVRMKLKPFSVFPPYQIDTELKWTSLYLPSGLCIYLDDISYLFSESTIAHMNNDPPIIAKQIWIPYES